MAGNGNERQDINKENVDSTPTGVFPWEEYSRKYCNYALSTTQTSILTIVTREVLEDFPKRLPTDLRKSISNMSTKLIEVFSRIKNAKHAQEKPGVKEFELDEFGDKLMLDLIANTLAQITLGYKFGEVDYERLLSHQQISMIFAQLDAFIADTLRAICMTRPEVMRSDKKVSVETILECESWEQLLSHLSEQYVFEFGWEPLVKRIDLLNKRFGLGIEYDNDDLKLLDIAEKTRHIVIHNGGRVNAEYIRQTGRTDVEFGEFIPLSSEYLDEVTWAARYFAREIYIQVSAKHFDIPQSELIGRTFWDKYD